jgi:hypothetical protein
MIDPTRYDTSGPGKFEAEPPETAYFYQRMLKGDGDYISDPNEAREATIFHITPEESDAFGLAEDRIFLLREDSAGFVLGTSHPNLEDAERTFARWLGH